MLQHKRAFSAQYDNLIQLVGPIGRDQVATDQMQDLLLSEQIVAVLVPVYVDRHEENCEPTNIEFLVLF